MSKKTRIRDLHAKLDALYARLPRLECRGLCANACGPIIISTGEAERMRLAHPDRRPLKTTPVRCAYLTKNNRCSVYAVRPLICRVWGLVKRMSCMHGCVPDRWLTDHEFVEIAAAIEAIAGPLLISTPNGIEPMGEKNFTTLRQRINAANAMPPELADEYAEKTLGLRALHGGRIIAVTPSDDPQWIDIEEE